MSHETEFSDPRSNITHPIDTGQVYEDSRTGRTLVLVFLSDDAALLREEDDHHILETRSQLDANIGSGRYSLQSEDGVGAMSAKVSKIQQLREQYENQDGRTAAHKVEALEEALELIENNGRPDDHETVDFSAVDGVGDSAAKALRSHGFSTKGDVRNADRDTITEVPYMGSKNTDALLDFVNDE